MQTASASMVSNSSRARGKRQRKNHARGISLFKMKSITKNSQEEKTQKRSKSALFSLKSHETSIQPLRVYQIGYIRIGLVALRLPEKRVNYR